MEFRPQLVPSSDKTKYIRMKNDLRSDLTERCSQNPNLEYITRLKRSRAHTAQSEVARFDERFEQGSTRDYPGGGLPTSTSACVCPQVRRTTFFYDVNRQTSRDFPPPFTFSHRLHEQGKMRSEISL